MGKYTATIMISDSLNAQIFLSEIALMDLMMKILNMTIPKMKTIID